MTSTRYHSSKHIDDTDLIGTGERCPVCGCNAPRVEAGMIQDDPDVQLLSCSRCGACSASRMPVARVIDDYYRGYFSDHGPKITLGHADRFARNLARAIRLAAESDTQIRVLDFGGGDGTLGLMVVERLLRGLSTNQTVEFTLVDYQSPREHGDKRIRVCHQRNLDEVQGTFDFILASAVLEHIPNLQAVMERLFRLLGPNGWFYARTPYIAPLKRFLPQLDITYPGHVHDLGAPFWNRVPETYHQPLRIIRSRPSPVETHLVHEPGRTVAAWLMKLPARVELILRSGPRVPWWRFVGGWEVILQRAAT